MKKTIIGVVGASKLSKKEKTDVYELGSLIAKEGWVTLTGGEPAGVMEIALKGAVESGGVTVGILWGTRKDPYSKFITIPVFTESGLGRDHFNILSSEIVVVCSHVSTGTLIEVAYALKHEVPIILLNVTRAEMAFIRKRGGKTVLIAKTPKDIISKIKAIIK